MFRIVKKTYLGRENRIQFNQKINRYIMNRLRLIKKTGMLIGVCIFSTNVYSQTATDKVADSTSTEQKRLKFGCGFGLNFVGGTNISIAPNLIYGVSDKVSFGGGIQGSYASIKDLQNTTTFGFNVIGQYSPVRKLTTLLEFTELRVSTKTETPTGTDTEKYWDSALFVGAGFNITDNIAIGAKYNLLYDKDKSVYTSPIIPFVNITF
jgi:hypothetical protein